MGQFLTTLPVNHGFYNLGTVQAYPTGGSGPPAYGPTSYFGSDPLPPKDGDSINNPIDLGDLTSPFRSVTISNRHGGKTRIQSSFYTFNLTSPRNIQIVQNYSPTSYQENTNRNTIISVYKIEDGNRRRELPINNSGYVYKETSIVDSDSDSSTDGYSSDYPSTPLDVGSYILLITNDIRYLETTYSFSVNIALVDWRYVSESIDNRFNFTFITEPVNERVDFGTITVPVGTRAYPYSSTSGLGYTQAGVSP
jgi:hypothetical protein